MPPTLPEPEALDQIRFGSTGSGVAQPLSPPRDRVPHAPRDDAAVRRHRRCGCCSGRGTTGRPACCRRRCRESALSTVTWYICAIGSRLRYHVRPRFVRDRERPDRGRRSCGSALVGSIHMSWWSPPGRARRRAAARASAPPSSDIAVVRGQEVGLVLVVGRDEDVRVVVRAAHRRCGRS